MDNILGLMQGIRPQDFLDIGLLTVIIYYSLMLIKGTRTIPILLGLTVILAAYVLSSILYLEAIGWVLENLFSSAVVILVVLFQGDIRNALARVGMTTMFREISGTAQTDLIDEVVSTAYTLSKRKIGGTIVLEHETGLRNYIERGRTINAQPTVDLMQSIFHTTSPLHDGAVIINKQGVLSAARCILPLTSNVVSSSFLGTRHRSAIGLSEETDAVVVVVSEERGHVSLAHEGELHRNLEENELRQMLTRILIGEEKSDAVSEVDPQTRTA